MNHINDDALHPNNPSTRPLRLRAGSSRPVGTQTVLFVALSALGVSAMPGLSGSLAGVLGTVVSTAHASENEGGEEAPGEQEATILAGYEEEIFAMLQEMGIEVPKDAYHFISLLELSNEYEATVIREGNVALLLTPEGETLPAPEGFYVFPDGLVTLVDGEGQILEHWGEQACGCGGGPWAMCRTTGGWVDCT